MISKDFKTLAVELGGKLLNDEYALAVFKGVAIDSRVVRGEQLFVAIVGEYKDGHNYIENAIMQNCAGLLVNHNFSELNLMKDRMPTVSVKNTHEAMKTMARHYRKESAAKLIALTGSNGKTTTKELIYSLLNAKTNKTYRSPGNFNNLFGLPLSIFEMPMDAEYAVFELGISVQGEMQQLAEITSPDIVLITNVGPTHLETLGTIENVAEEKFSLIDNLDRDKPAVLNADDPIIMAAASKRNREFITYGFRTEADYKGKFIGYSKTGFPLVEIDGLETEIRLFGEHQAYNILAAYSVCRGLGLEIKSEDFKNISYEFAQYRGEIENISGLTVIADCYNANPTSMISGLRSFHHFLNRAENKSRPGILILGDMLELGEDSARYHRQIGQLIGELGFDDVITVGPMSADIYDSAIRSGMKKEKINHFADAAEAGDFLISNLPRGGIIYLKASRGIGLEKIITLLRGAAFRNN